MVVREGSHVTDDEERYQRYLCSREWAELRNAVLSRCGGICERCRWVPASHVHHLTYIRKYRERPEDLMAMCAPCHEFTHGKRDRDPLTETTHPQPWIMTCRKGVTTR